MPQPTDTHRTTKDLSPEELREYRLRLDQHLQNRKVDEALLQRAWQTAHRVAAMLYEDFRATQVAVFGSLAERDWFSKWSDIDIAIWASRLRSTSVQYGKLRILANCLSWIWLILKGVKGRFKRELRVSPLELKKAKPILWTGAN